MLKSDRNYRTTYAAFIITYERPHILLQSIEKLLAQTFPPCFILVVDNSDSGSTEEVVTQLDIEHIGYHRVGYNSGPAGAARIGLEKLAGLGYEWIYWGDDDNPPIDTKVLEDLFQVLYGMEDPRSVGLFGGKGGRLNRITGRIDSFSNAALEKAAILEVDSIPGGASLLVNSELVTRDILPDEKLFFGFEELDYCLRIQQAGYKLLVNTKVWLRENHQLGYKDAGFQWKASHFGKSELLWRSYYSTRNLLYIYSKNGYFLAFLFLMLRAIAKSLLGFRFGLGYGRRNFNIQWRAIFDFLGGKFGKSPLY